MFSSFKPPTVCQELTKLIEEMSKTILNMKKQSESLSGLSTSIYSIIKSETPSFSKYFTKIADIYIRLSNIYANGANSMDRAIEDLRDVNARFAVLKRIEDERVLAKESFREAMKAAKEAQKSLTFEKPDAKTTYEKAEQHQAACAKILFEQDKKLLEYKKKFSNFSMRRYKSGWKLYGEALSNIYVLESAEYNELAKIYKSIRDHSEDPERIFSRICGVQGKDAEIENIMPSVDLKGIIEDNSLI